MGSPYVRLEEMFTDISCDPENNIVVEIGSGVGEGSTEWLYNWATKRQLPFYSVDVISDTKNQLGHLNINFVVQAGHEWCRDVLPSLTKKIKVLYLDNFDYIWESTPNNLKMWGDQTPKMLEMFENQKKAYAQRGIELTRENSMEEHRLQVMYCLPFMSDTSVVLMDDTFIGDHGIYGKCTTAIPLLTDAGYQLIIDQNTIYGAYKQ